MKRTLKIFPLSAAILLFALGGPDGNYSALAESGTNPAAGEMIELTLQRRDPQAEKFRA